MHLILLCIKYYLYKCVDLMSFKLITMKLLHWLCVVVSKYYFGETNYVGFGNRMITMILSRTEVFKSSISLLFI